MRLEDLNIDSTKSIAELLGEEILQPAFHSSLTENVTKYSNTPLSEISSEGLRLLLVQNFYLDFVVPAAICCLERNPYAGGDLEEGALMRTLFTIVNRSFWEKNPLLLKEAEDLLRISRIKLRKDIASESDPETKSLLLDADENYGQAEVGLVALKSIKP